jgi:hypothetical protein
MTTKEPDELPPPIVWAGRILKLFGLVVLAHFYVASFNQVGATLTDLGVALLILVVAVVSQQGLRHRARWAWTVALLLALGSLFFAAPVTGTIVLGGGTEPIGTGWDLFFFPGVTVMMLTLLALLARTWRETGREARARAEQQEEAE